MLALVLFIMCDMAYSDKLPKMIASVPQNCPISNHPFFTQRGNYHFPSDIFDPSFYSAHKDLTEDCWNKEECTKHNFVKLNYHCPKQVPPCPIASEMLYQAKYRMQDWYDFNKLNLCSLKKHLDNPKATVRVIIFGGSVTYGSFAGGCKKNSPFDRNPNSAQDRECVWSVYLADWLDAASAATVEKHNLAVPGQTYLYYYD